MTNILTKLLLGLAFSFALIFAPATIFADTPTNADQGQSTSSSGTSTDSATPPNSDCDKTPTSDSVTNCVKNNQIVKDLQTIINALSIGVGVIVVAAIVVGGVQYMAAGENAEAVSKAKHRIANALIALVAFIFIFAFLQWLIPGGVFG